VHNPVWGALRSFRVTASVGRGAAVDVQLSDVSANESEAIRLMQTGGVYWLPAQPDMQAHVVQGAHGYEVTVNAGDVLVATVHIQHTTGQRWFSWALGQSRVWDVEHDLAHSLKASSAQSQGNNLSASLPGRISEVMVSAGDTVQAGDPVLTLEAMKLYHGLSAPVSGTVRAVHVKLGDIVGQGHLLVEIEPAAENVATA